jgi:tetrahydromethanopterin S-methyltransferase subunit F
MVMAVVVFVRFQLVPQDLKEGNVIVSSISGFCCGLVVAGMINFNKLAREAKQQDG